MSTTPAAALQALSELKLNPDTRAVSRKLALLKVLEEGTLQSSDEVAALHETLCFMRAYPDSAAVAGLAENMLDRFSSRKDLLRFQRALADTGIAGTTIHYHFYWQTARWLFERWPEAITIDWTEWEHQDHLTALWPILLPPPALEALEHLYLSPRKWIETLKRPDDTDAAFLIRHFVRLKVQDAVRENIYDDLDVPLRLSPARGSPSRTLSKYADAKLTFTHPSPFSKLRIAEQVKQKPLSVRMVSVAQGRKLIDLARVQMITRGRDLYGFVNACPNDVRIVSYADGLQFICYGLMPEHRPLMEAMYVFIIVKNGVPIGYTQAATLFNSAEINFNIFDTFRGTETSLVFVKTLAMAHHLFASTAFIINTQQVGEDNPEALKSGAFWFYYKHGFRPSDPQVRAVARDEHRLKKTEPGYRSSIHTLKKLARSDLRLFLADARTDLVNTIAVHNVGVKAAQVMEIHARHPRSSGAGECIKLAMQLLNYRPVKPLTPSRRIAWERWSPIVILLTNLGRWSLANKRRLVEIINAKGGRRESEFVALFDRHKLLRAAILRLARDH